jgi:tetratricopeptide (TPR) repeat protein
VTPKARVMTIIALAAALAAVVTVGATAFQSRNDPAGAATAPRTLEGRPPLVLELGLRRDSEAGDLRRAARAYARGQVGQARTLFAGSKSLEGRVGLALAAWPEGTVPALQALAAEHPQSALVGVNLGAALLWARQGDDARAAWRRAARLEPDSVYAVRADDLLHLDTPRGLPPFIPGAPVPRAVLRLPPERQVEALARAARRGGAEERLLYGVALQRAGRPLSAQRAFTAAARVAPTDVEALTADAVGRFRKSRPTPAFSRLGPLTQRFPHAAVVRLHLGLLLLWLGEVPEARPQLERAVALGRGGPHGRQAARFLRLLPAE